MEHSLDIEDIDVWGIFYQCKTCKTVHINNWKNCITEDLHCHDCNASKDNYLNHWRIPLLPRENDHHEFFEREIKSKVENAIIQRLKSTSPVVPCAISYDFANSRLEHLELHFSKWKIKTTDSEREACVSMIYSIRELTPGIQVLSTSIRNGIYIEENCECDKYGIEYLKLTSLRKEGRKKSDESWKKSIQKTENWRAYICSHCQEKIHWDKSIETLMLSRDEAKIELEAHKNSCSKKNSSEQIKKTLLQTKWEEVTKSVDIRRYYECNECWGKIVWDKNIKDAKTAMQQALSDLKYHRDHECNLEPSKRTIAVYYSPNQGGNKHAPIDNSLTENEITLLKQDNLDQFQKEKATEPSNYLPHIFGGIGIIALGVILSLYLINKKKK